MGVKNPGKEQERVAHMKTRVGIVASHPVQYCVPWYRALAKEVDLTVFYCHRQTAQGQAKAGYAVEFEWDIPLFEGYKSRWLNNVAKNPGPHFWGCDTPEVKSIIDSGKIDTVITQGWHLKSHWQTHWACWRNDIPIMVWGDSQLQSPRSLLKKIIKKAIYPRLIPKYDAYLVAGERNRDYLLHYGADKAKMFHVPRVVDNQRFTRVDKQVVNKLVKSLELEDWSFIVLFVGRFVRWKRPIDLIKAVAKLRTTGVDAVVLFVGEGRLRKDMEGAASNYNVPVRFSGFVNQSKIPLVYHAADVLTLPSEGENWGVVVNEAMASGIPAVVSDQVGSAPDLIDEGETGFTFPCGDIKALGKKLLTVYKMQQEGNFQEALKRKMEKYSVKQAVAGTLEAIDYVLS